MLSLFPDLLFLSPFAALLIRIALAVVFGYSAWLRVRNNATYIKLFGAIDGVIAVMLFLGIYTQLAALFGMLCAIAWLVKSSISPYPKSTAALALVMCLSILIMGAGLWKMTLVGITFPLAFDLPL